VRVRFSRLASACSFAIGAVMDLLVATIASPAKVIPIVAGTSLMFLALPGGLVARAGGAGVMVGALRVTFWGALAMAMTAGSRVRYSEHVREPSLAKLRHVTESNAVGCAVVNLDQFCINTRTILVKEHFRIGLVSSPSSKDQNE
jgi:hypothetical protein